MTKHTIFVVLGLIGCSFAVACSSSTSGSSTKGTGGSTGSSGTSGGSGFTCDIKTAAYEYCEDYSNLPAADMAAIKSECTSAMGTAGTSCPTANALGTCSVSAGGISYSETFYMSTGFTATEAQSACTGSGGKWTAA